MVSAELFARDGEFRKLVRAKLPSGFFKEMIPVAKPNANQYKIIFAIIGNRSDTGEINIPFFSKVALRRCYNQLRGFNFNVYLNFIPLEDDVGEEESEEE